MLDTQIVKHYLAAFRIDALNEVEIDHSDFSLEKLSSLPSFKSRIEYAKKYLPRIGVGSSRIVFKYDSESVLKLAKNRKGIEQNLLEYEMSKEHIIENIIAKVIEADVENFYWIRMEMARPARKADFKKIWGIDFDTFSQFVQMIEREVRPPYPTRSRSEDELHDMVAETIPEYVYIKLYSLLADFEMADLSRITSWGVTPDGELKVIDYGANEDIISNFYM